MFARKIQSGVLLFLVLLICCQACSVCLGAEPPDADRGSLARRILADSGGRGRLVVHVGCGDGRLTAALGAKEGCLVHGLDTDAARIEQARKQIQSLGLLGDVFVTQFDGKRLPYADNMVNLIVVDTRCEIPDASSEILRVLTPRGVAIVREKGNEALLSHVPHPVSRTGAGFVIFTKPVLAEIDEWTHWLHGPDGNAVAEDTIAGPPRRLQWIAKPYWSRHHNTVPSVSDFVSAGGRVFYIVDEAPGGMGGSTPDKWSMVARDAFNGLPLWRRPMPEWGWKTWSDDWKSRFTVPTHISRRLVAVDDHVYVTLGFNAPLTELNAATGEVLRTFDGTEFTDEILYVEGTLIVAINGELQKPGNKTGDSPPPVPKRVAAIDVTSGRMLWENGRYVGLRSKTGSMERISHLSMCAGDGRVFFVDRDRIVSLSLADGRELWHASRPESPEFRARYDIRISDMCSLVCQQGVLFFTQTNPATKRLGWRGERGRLHAFSAATGEELWNRQCCSWGWGHPADVFVVDGLVWVHDFETPFIMGMNPTTGEVQRKVSNFKAFDNGHHHRCYRNKATTRFMMTSYRGLEFIDWAGESTSLNHWVRGTCRLGAFPCNGLVYATPHPCGCYISSKLNGFVALAPEGESFSTAPEAHPLRRGPAFGQARDARRSPLDSSDWPMYRHDRRRSGSTGASLSPNMSQAWEVDLGAKPTSCVAVGDTVLAAVPDLHQVVALCAKDGRRIWSFTTGGPVDTPPTIDRGRAYVGCADGWLYCLRMSDGQLVWRLRGALRDRLVGALDGVESAWPIHGSPLVDDGVVYFTAGRSSFLDGGILAFAANADMGEILERRTIRSEHAMEVDTGANRLGDTGLLTDLLVGRGESITMRQRQIFPKPEIANGSKTRPAETNVFLRTTSGMLDDEWFSRVRWYLGDRPVAEYFVFDDESVYGVRAREAMSTNGGFFTPGARGYELMAADLEGIQGADAARGIRAGKRGTGVDFAKRWSIRVPVRVTAMVAARDTLFAAGSPDILDPTDPWAAYEGRRGGKLLVLSAADGKVLAEREIDAPPVLDGMAVAHGRLLVSNVNGKIVCFE